MSGEGTYAPKSPDLSSFYSGGPTQSRLQNQRPPSQQLLQAIHLQPPPSYYNPLPVTTSSLEIQSQPLLDLHSPSGSHSYTYPENYQGAAYLSQDYSLSASLPNISNQNFVPPQIPVHATHGFHPAYQESYGNSEYQGPAPQHPLRPHQTFAPQSQSYAPLAPQSHHPTLAVPVKHESLDPSEPSRLLEESMPPRRSAAAAAAQQQLPPPIPESPVRTKFPTARIKRIMQADEEVGKVAQQTPIAVGKALEMFMIQMVTKSAEVAKDKNSKRVTAQMLKQVVESDEQWDFLREIVSKVENEEKAAKSGKSAKNESESDEEMVVEKRKGKPGRKKKVPV